MLYDKDSEFQDWFMSTLPKDLDLKSPKYSKKEILEMLEVHVKDITEILSRVKKSITRS